MILRHKDRELLRFEWVEPEGVRVVSVNERERRFLPLGMNGVATDEGLWKWLCRRTVPRNRHYVDAMLGHLGIRHGDTRAIIGLCMGAAPIFDNGNSLFSLALDNPGSPYDDFSDLRRFTDRIAPVLYESWLSFPGALSGGMAEQLARLKGFRFRHHRHYNLTDERLAKIEGFIQNRVAKILECGIDADASLRLPATGGGSVNRTNKQPLAVQIKGHIEADPFITYVELSEIIGVAQRTIARKMKELQEAGEIRRVGADKNGHWEIIAKEDRP